MAKKDLFKLCLVAATVMSASSASAGITGSMIIGGGTYSPSNRVQVNVVSTDVAYAAKSGHTSGDRTIFTNNSDPKMYWTSKATGTTPDTVSGETETVSGWTTL